MICLSNGGLGYYSFRGVGREVSKARQHSASMRSAAATDKQSGTRNKSVANALSLSNARQTDEKKKSFYRFNVYKKKSSTRP